MIIIGVFARFNFTAYVDKSTDWGDTKKCDFDLRIFGNVIDGQCYQVTGFDQKPVSKHSTGNYHSRGN